MIKITHFSSEARNKIIRGAMVVADAVAVSLGPRGRNAVIEKSFGSPVITKDGISIAKEIELEDETENIGAQLIKEVASKTADSVGDGTSSATVFAQAILREGIKGIEAGMSPSKINTGIDTAVKEVLTGLKEFVIPCETNETILQVATIAANGDQEVGSVIAEATAKTGSNGTISVVEGQAFTHQLTFTEGLSFDRGYASPYLTTNNEPIQASNPVILITDENISNVQEVVPLMEACCKSGQHLIIIADGFDQEVLSSFIVNNLRGTLRISAIKAPGFGEAKSDILDDIAIACGTKVAGKERGNSIKELKIEDLGSCKQIKISKDNTVVIGGKGDNTQVVARIQQLEELLKTTSTKYEREKLEQRVSKLSSGVAIIHVGAFTEIEIKETKDRVEDAVAATKVAIRSGIVAGGGASLIHAGKKLQTVLTDPEENFGYGIIKKALEAPLRRIAFNSDQDSGVIFSKIRDAKEHSFGYNAKTNSFGDMLEMGVIDPLEVVSAVVCNATSIAKLMLTTDVSISIKKKENKAEHSLG